jgi:hypothetical protein
MQYDSNESDEWILWMSSYKEDHAIYRTHHLYQIQSIKDRECYWIGQGERTNLHSMQNCKIHQQNKCHFRN